MACCWKQFTSHRKCFSNMKSEISKQSYDLYEKTRQYIQLPSYMPENSLQIHPIKTVIDGLKVNSTIDCKKAIKNVDLQSVLSNNQLLRDIDILFDLGKIENRNDVLSNKRSLGLINTALSSWCRSKLVKIKESRKQSHDKVGKKFNMFDYKLQNKFEVELIETCTVVIDSLEDIYLF